MQKQAGSTDCCQFLTGVMGFQKLGLEFGVWLSTWTVDFTGGPLSRVPQSTL